MHDWDTMGMSPQSNVAGREIPEVNGEFHGKNYRTFHGEFSSKLCLMTAEATSPFGLVTLW
jgi:hypothetical protein